MIYYTAKGVRFDGVIALVKNAVYYGVKCQDTLEDID